MFLKFLQKTPFPSNLEFFYLKIFLNFLNFYSDRWVLLVPLILKAILSLVISMFQEWWTNLWLNEGYASFVEFLCVAYLFPEYDIWSQFVTDSYCRALELDALESSHPIEVRYRNDH